MPIKDRSIYPDNWDQIREAILWRSTMWEEEGNPDSKLPRCECEGECGLDHHGRCPKIHHKTIGTTYVVLTIAHLDHDASLGNHEDDNLKAMCQGCHLRFDSEPNRERRTGQPRLPLIAEGLHYL